MAAPYGVFALLGGLVVDFGGSADLFIALGLYSVTVIIGLLIMILVVYPLVLRIFTKVKYVDFFKELNLPVFPLLGNHDYIASPFAQILYKKNKI
mgnify:CR=1 FL=1